MKDYVKRNYGHIQKRSKTRILALSLLLFILGLLIIVTPVWSWVIKGVETTKADDNTAGGGSNPTDYVSGNVTGETPLDNSNSSSNNGSDTNYVSGQVTGESSLGGNQTSYVTGQTSGESSLEGNSASSVTGQVSGESPLSKNENTNSSTGNSGSTYVTGQIGGESPLSNTGNTYVTGSIGGESPLDSNNTPTTYVTGTITGESPLENPTPATPKATIIYQGGMCDGNDAWWVNKWSDGHIDWVKNYGHQPNECGNTVPQPTNPPAAQTPTISQPVSTHNGTSYPQCGGTAGLEGFASNHTFIVTPVLDSNGNVISYDHDDKGVLSGQCGNPQATTAQAAPVTTTTTQVVSTAACNDDVTYFDPSVGQYIHKHGGRAYNPSSAYETQTKDANGCIYAFDQVAAPLVTTCKGQINENDLESQLHGANYPGPFGLQYQSAEVQAYNNAACPLSTPTPTPMPLVTSVTCPTGTTATMNGNTVVCVSTTPALTSTPVSTTTRQLPETGVPLAAISLGGLVPLGLKLKRFNKLTEKISSQSIWKDREFKSVLK